MSTKASKMMDFKGYFVAEIVSLLVECYVYQIYLKINKDEKF